MVIKYHDPSSCNKCGEGMNKFIDEIWDGSVMCEVRTQCRQCGHKDYWGYGYFESAAEIISKCRMYIFSRDMI